MQSVKNILNKYKTIPIQVKASLWFLICSFLQKGISMISTPIFTRLLTTFEYGKYSVFNSWLEIITVFVSFNLSQGVYAQGIVKFEKERYVFSSTLQGLSTTLILVWTVVYCLFSNMWNSLFGLTTVQMLAMLILIWTTAVYNFWSNEQRVEYKYKALVILTIVVSIAKPLIGIVFVLLADDKVTARILGITLVEIICYSGLFIAQMNRGKRFFSRKFWEYALLFNLPLIPHYLSQMVLNGADRIMISKMVGDGEAGIYSLAYSLSMIMVIFNTALMQTISPWIYQRIKAKRIKEVAPVAYTTLILVATVNLVLILLAPEAVFIFAPRDYHEAVYIIPPIALSVYYMYSYDLFAKFAFYYEKTKLIMAASVIGAMLNIVLNYIFISLYGYMAAGYTTLACYIIYSIAHYKLMNFICIKYCNGEQPYDTRIIIIISLIFTILGFIFLLLYNYPIIRYGTIIVIIIIIYMKRYDILKIINSLVILKAK